MRLIDADAIRVKAEYIQNICGIITIRTEDLVRIINEQPTIPYEQKDDYKKILSDYRYLTRKYIKLLDKKIPLITNGQEPVQCKDCKHGKSRKNVKGEDMVDCLLADNWLKRPDWFCADGERKEKDD
jgi:hypothetical protein